MKLVKTVGAALVAGAFAVSVQAAEPIKLASLADVNGKVLVNKGKGYVSAKSGTVLDAGDRVISLDGSKAAVVFPDGCVTQLKENSLLSLDKGAGCGKQPTATGAASQPLRYAQAIGGTVTDAGPGGVAAGGGGVAGGVSLTTVLVGGSALVFTVAGINDARSDDTPISGQ